MSGKFNLSNPLNYLALLVCLGWLPTLAASTSCGGALNKTKPLVNDYNLEPIPRPTWIRHIINALREEKIADVAEIDPSEIEINLTEMKLNIENGNDKGGNSNSYKSIYRGVPVHIKQQQTEIEGEVSMYSEMSRRNMAPRLFGVTRIKGKANTCIVSEFVEPVVFVKAIASYDYEDNREILLPRMQLAIQGCPMCKRDWLDGIRKLGVFLSENKISVHDPQIMLMPDGRVYLYDFGLYKNNQHDYHIQRTLNVFSQFATALEEAKGSEP